VSPDLQGNEQWLGEIQAAKNCGVLKDYRKKF